MQMDVRQPDAASVPAWQLSADVEALAWDPHHPTQFVVASEDGVVAAYDARQVCACGGGSNRRLQQGVWSWLCLPNLIPSLVTNCTSSPAP